MGCPQKHTRLPNCVGEWPGAKPAPEVAQAVADMPIGQTRARCKDDVCVLEFDRVSEDVHRQVIERVREAGYAVTSASVDQKGDKTFGADVVLKRKRKSKKR